MLIQDHFISRPGRVLSAPVRRLGTAQVAQVDQTHLSPLSQVGQCPTGPQVASSTRLLCKQARALGEQTALAPAGPAQQATGQLLAQFRQGLCPYLSQASKDSPDLSALSLLNSALQQNQLDPADFLQGVHQHYGPTLRVGEVQFENRPEVVQKVLISTDNPVPDRNWFGKSSFLQLGLGEQLGHHSLFLESDRAWLERRELMTPFFLGPSVTNPQKLQQIESTVARHLDRLAGQGESVDLNRVFRCMTLDIACQHMFSQQLGEVELGELVDDLATAARHSQEGFLGRGWTGHAKVGRSPDARTGTWLAGGGPP